VPGARVGEAEDGDGVTCIVGVEHGGSVFIGADAFASNHHDGIIMRARKVHRVGACIMGHAGSGRRANVLHHLLGAVEIPPRDVERFIVKRLVPRILEAMALAKVNHVPSEGSDDAGDTLLGIGGHLYHIEADLSILRSRCGYAASGSGYAPALGVLFATPWMPPRKRIRLALEAAEFHTPFVRRPWTILECKKEARR
jgi:hypothetical protein